MPNDADIARLLSKVGASVAELEGAVTELLFARMPAGFELDGVEFEGGLQFVAYTQGLSTVQDVRDLAAGLNTDLGYDYTPSDEAVLLVSVQVGPVTVRFEHEVSEEEWLTIRSELFAS